MLCKTSGFQDGDNEGCRFLRYIRLVHTSQETHYVSATELSQLMLCEILGFSRRLFLARYSFHPDDGGGFLQEPRGVTYQ
jgi:hypothetical protein